MLEKYMILTQEFKNVKNGSVVTGFQVKVRLPYYRGFGSRPFITWN